MQRNAQTLPTRPDSSYPSDLSDHPLPQTRVKSLFTNFPRRLTISFLAHYFDRKNIPEGIENKVNNAENQQNQSASFTPEPNESFLQNETASVDFKTPENRIRHKKGSCFQLYVNPSLEISDWIVC
jgi:hypothetical protein